MKRIVLAFLVTGLLCFCPDTASSQNPFTSGQQPDRTAPEPLIKNPLFARIIVWQHQLQQKMSATIRRTQDERSAGLLLSLVGIAFAYGVLHAAGPGHGKAAAVSYVLAHRATLARGLLFGLSFSVIHALSGVAGVVGLRFIIQRSFSQTLESVTAATQIISFGLIALLGLVILLKHARELLPKAVRAGGKRPESVTRKRTFAWAAAVGLVPCPAVVMVMLFCLSMDVMVLGLVLAACISAGMAVTISAVVIAVIMGKSGALSAVSDTYALWIERGIGCVSGAAIAVFGTLFCLSNIQAVL